MIHAQNRAEAGHTLLSRLADARFETDRLFDLLRVDALYARPIPERHRIIFYLGHLEAFDWNLLHGRLSGLTPIHRSFDKLFAFGIDPVDGGLPSDEPRDWPSRQEVDQFNHRVRESIDKKLEAVQLADNGASADRLDFPLSVLVNVAIEHRLMHAETLAYMWHQLPIEKKIPQIQSAEASGGPVSLRMVEIPAGRATLGTPRSANVFGWDNEFESHAVDVPAFEIDAYKVTNRQFLEFLLAGGYDNPAYWSPEAWKWITEAKITHPVFWRQADDGWRWQTMFDEVPLPPDWPVYVSHAEASAFARWKGKKLPTEAQWHHASFGAPDGLERPYPWGNWLHEDGNFNFHRWDPVPVDSHPRGQSAFGVYGTVGNGWEWTSTVFGPFPDFAPFPFYAGYSANFFDGQHYVLKGGSARTAACMLRRSFRNWFQPHYQYMYAAFRGVND